MMMATLPGQHRSPSPVLLVSMPWTMLTEPSLGLSMLKAVLDREGIPCRVLHLNLHLLEFMQSKTYDSLARVYCLNDFLFSGVLDPTITLAQERVLRERVQELINGRGIDLLRVGGFEGLVETLLRFRHEVIPQWLDTWADKIASDPAALVGFTCMFDQTIASLALAKRIKERAPDKTVVLGGYAIRTPTAEMVMHSCPWIDAICNGDGEYTITDLALAASGSLAISAVRGILYRTESGDIIETAPPPQVNLDSNPTPNFDDFFADLRTMSDQYMIDITPLNLPLENSRGCWWGAKHHCVFCGIRDEDMAYRARNASRVLASMAELYQRYGIERFRFADYILPNGYFEQLLPELIRIGSPYKISCEMKSNITEERFASLARAGFKEVQPGIESISSDALRKMDKGVSAVQNVHTLVMGKRFGVGIYYNLIHSFPSDDPEVYEHFAATLPRLMHLDPPISSVAVQITRFAPLQTRPAVYGIERGGPEPCYDLIFSAEYLERTGFDLDHYCYYFERTFHSSVRLQRLYDQIDDIVLEWKLRLIHPSWLYVESTNASGTRIRDKRTEQEIIHEIDPLTARVLEACSTPVILAKLQETAGADLTVAQVETAIHSLDKLGLIFCEEGRAVSLVLPGPPKVVAETPDNQYTMQL